MRKVRYKKWIPIEYTNNPYQRVSNTGCFEKAFSYEGLFHQWGSSYEEFESGTGNFTVALVETANGEITEVLPCNIIFDDKPQG